MLDLEKYLNKDADQKQLYEELVELGKTRKLGKTEYSERHHILPRCMGGTDGDDNLVTFTALEHIVAHILLYRMYPDNLKIAMAADCMLMLDPSSTKERSSYFSQIPLEILAELREKASKAKEIAIACYLKKDEDGKEIEIHRIFSSASKAAKELECPRTTIKEAIRKEQKYDTLGYYWDKLSNLESNYPEAVALYNSLSDEELPVCNFNSTTYSRSEILCYDSEYNIIKIYKNSEEITKDGLYLGRVKRHSSFNNSSPYMGVFWSRLSNWDRKDKLDEYYNNPELREDAGLVFSYRNIVQLDSSNNIVKIHKTKEEAYKYTRSSKSYNSFLKIFEKKDKEDRLLNDHYWITVKEFLELYPDRKEELKDKLYAKEDDDSGRSDSTTEMKILLTIPEKLVSVNDLYKAKIAYKAGRPYPVLYKNPKSVQNGNVIIDQLRVLDLKGYIPWLNKTKKYEILINFILKTGVYRRDVSNLDKDVIDYITSFIKNDLGVDHFDDSEIFHCSFTKSICPGAKKEMICFILRESFMEERIDVIEKPTRLYLDGPITSANPWRDTVTDCLKDVVEVFNPELELYDAETRKSEKDVLCDSTLYLITPGDLSEKLSQRILEEVTFKTSDKFLYVGVTGDLLEYSPEEIDRIELLRKLIENSGKNKTYYKKLEKIEDVKNWIK